MYTRFEIEPDYVDALRAAGLADFDALMNAPAGPPTSKHKHRETVPIEFDVNGKRQRFFLKRVFKVPGQHSWRPWLRGKPGYSQPVREWDNIQMMRDAGIPVMKRVAVGERRKFGIPVQAFILVEDVGIQWTLENWLIPGFPKPPGIERIDTGLLLYELGKVQRQIDAKNIRWPDNHAKHIHAEPCENPSDDAAWRFALIDVERAERRPPLPDPADVFRKKGIRPPTVSFVMPRELSQLLMSLRPEGYGPRSLVDFWSGYQGRPRLVQPNLFDSLFPWMNRWMEPLPLPDGFVHPRSQGTRWLSRIKASESDRNLLAGIGIQDVADAFKLEISERLDKPGLQPHRDRLRVSAPDQLRGDLVLFIKRYRRPPLRDQLRRIFEADRTHSTSYREYQTARRLMELGIPTMRAVAVGEEMVGWFERRSFFVAAEVAGQSLESLARQWLARPESAPDFNQRWSLIEQIAFLKSRLRERHFYHRDLYLSHIFCSKNSRGQTVLQLIDLARMLHAPRNEQRWEIKDLAALAYSVPDGLLTRTDKLRFMRALGCDHFRSSRLLKRSDPEAQAHRQHLLLTIHHIERRVAKMARHDAKRAKRLGLRSDESN